MISAIVTDLKDEPGLAGTIACLTPAAIDGFVRELIVADTGASAANLAVADDAGARIVSGSLEAACPLARQPWLLILPAGVRLQVGWEAAALGHINHHPGQAGWFRLNYAADGLAARAGESWANGVARWLGAPRPEHGLLISAKAWAGARGVGRRPIEARILAAA